MTTHGVQPYEQVGFLALAGEADRAVLLGRDALAAAVAAGDAVSELMLRHVVGMALSQLRQYDSALAELDAAAALGERLGLPAARATAWSTEAWTMVLAGRPEDGLRLLARADAVLAALEPELQTAVAASNLGLSATQLGLLELGARWFDYVEDHLELMPDGRRRAAHSGNHSILHFEWGLAHEHAGEAGPAADRYRRCAALGARMGTLAEEEHWRLVSEVSVGACAAKLGRPEESLRRLAAVIDHVDTGTVQVTRCAAHLGWAWAALAADRPAECREHGAVAVRLAVSVGYQRWEADAHRALARCAGQAGDIAGEQAHNARAADLLAELDWQARLRRLGVTLGLGVPA